jgi:hypothetical protein
MQCKKHDCDPNATDCCAKHIIYLQLDCKEHDCDPNATDCCAKHIIYLQLDCKEQSPLCTKQLKLLVTSA